jgi:hypothetical protein
MRLYHELCLHFGRLLACDRVLDDGALAKLGEVPEEILLPLGPRLVLVAAVGWLLGLREEFVEDSKVDARDPHRPRLLHGGAEHPTVLYVLPFTGGQLEGLRLGKCGQRLARQDSQRQRVLGALQHGVGRGRQWCRIFDGEARPLALESGFGTLHRRLFGRLWRRRCLFAGARSR